MTWLGEGLASDAPNRMTSAEVGQAGPVIHAPASMAFKDRNADLAQIERMGAVGAKTFEAIKDAVFGSGTDQNQTLSLGSMYENDPFAAAPRVLVGFLQTHDLNLSPSCHKCAQFGFLDERERFGLQAILHRDRQEDQ